MDGAGVEPAFPDGFIAWIPPPPLWRLPSYLCDEKENTNNVRILPLNDPPTIPDTFSNTFIGIQKI